ncbi:MAG: AAA-like domain-containing protein [Clostridiales bacterium]|nr:AAA-like domain-containing protein [Clostridiales bacterium]
MKEFNTTAVCIPSKHYMVDLSERVAEIKKLVDAGKYFTINRARQYGKTTTLKALQQVLRNEYTVISLSFEGITNAGYQSEGEFVQSFSRLILDQSEFFGISIPDATIQALEKLAEQDPKKLKMDELFRTIRRWVLANENQIVLFIDEVDSATNNQVFLDFLGLLRDGYISREKDGAPALQSVILAGVTDVKHLKSKIRPDDEHKVNSPWNIAADFLIDMSLSDVGIKGMLDEYEADHHTGMDTETIAKLIRKYTNGYPYLVSRICQRIDQSLVPEKFDDLSKAWTEYGVDEAVKLIISESGNALFESLSGKLTNYPDLKEKLRSILMRGETVAWLPYDEEQQQLYMYGFIRNNHNTVAIANQMFEMLLYTHFIGESDKNNELKQKASEFKSIFVDADGWLDVPKIMDHFIREHNRIHKDNTEKFIEEEGRERFITYVSGIINGTGTYSVEDQTRDHKRMDLVIHYLGRRYIVEMKIWHGDRYNEKGEKQIAGYLDHYGLDTGYMLSFNFNKKKESGVKRVQIGDKVLFEGTV